MVEERADSRKTPEERADSRKTVEVTAADLPLHCPPPSQMLWNTHPRVYLPVEATGEARCPYCGTLYTLAGGPVAGHH